MASLTFSLISSASRRVQAYLAATAGVSFFVGVNHARQTTAYDVEAKKLRAEAKKVDPVGILGAEQAAKEAKDQKKYEADDFNFDGAAVIGRYTLVPLSFALAGPMIPIWGLPYVQTQLHRQEARAETLEFYRKVIAAGEPTPAPQPAASS